MKPDGNVAFKVTWVYGTKGPFTSPCTREGRRLNIKVANKVWCSQPECACSQLYRAGNTADPLTFEHSPCNDVRALRDWKFSAGWFHDGPKKGNPIPFKYGLPGKFAFLTTRSCEMPERDRLVIACYEISDLRKEDGEIWAHSVHASRVRVRDLDAAPRFWRYHRQSGGPRWNTGLFRYLPDTEAKRLHDALLKAAEA